MNWKNDPRMQRVGVGVRVGDCGKCTVLTCKRCGLFQSALLHNNEISPPLFIPDFLLHRWQGICTRETMCFWPSAWPCRGSGTLKCLPTTSLFMGFLQCRPKGKWSGIWDVLGYCPKNCHYPPNKHHLSLFPLVLTEQQGLNSSVLPYFTLPAFPTLFSSNNQCIERSQGRNVGKIKDLIRLEYAQ